MSAELRTEFGKGAARRTRRAGKVPAVLYGHGQDPRHIALPARELGHALRGGANVLLSLELNGRTELAAAQGRAARSAAAHGRPRRPAAGPARREDRR